MDPSPRRVHNPLLPLRCRAERDVVMQKTRPLQHGSFAFLIVILVFRPAERVFSLGIVGLLNRFSFRPNLLQRGNPNQPS
jgi:hypothetical protein